MAYHFEREIEEVLQHIYDSYPDGDDMEGYIYDVALRFQLLRLARHDISCGKIPKNHHAKVKMSHPTLDKGESL